MDHEIWPYGVESLMRDAGHEIFVPRSTFMLSRNLALQREYITYHNVIFMDFGDILAKLNASM